MMARKGVPGVAGEIVFERISVYFKFLEMEYQCSVIREIDREPRVTYTAPEGAAITIEFDYETPPKVFLHVPPGVTLRNGTQRYYDAEDLALAFGYDELKLPFVPLSHGLTVEILEIYLGLQAQAVRKFAGEFLVRGSCDVFDVIAKFRRRS